jgi:hypothetical protein
MWRAVSSRAPFAEHNTKIRNWQKARALKVYLLSEVGLSRDQGRWQACAAQQHAASGGWRTDKAFLVLLDSVRSRRSSQPVQLVMLPRIVTEAALVPD